MIKKSFLLFLFISTVSFAQGTKSQKIGLVDMEYILENIPEYVEAQAKLTAKANDWEQEIEKANEDVVKLQNTLNNERILLTQELISEKEDFIDLKKIDVKNLQNKYFGIKGDYYKLRQILVKPIQDEVYNSVQEIAKKRKFDMVLDKSSELIFLYSDNKYDISELVLKTIERAKKIRKRSESDIAKDQPAKLVPTEKEEKVANIKAAKKTQKFQKTKAEKEARQQEIEKKRAERKKIIEERKAAIKSKREQRLKEIEALKQKKAAEKNSKQEETEEQE